MDTSGWTMEECAAFNAKGGTVYWCPSVGFHVYAPEAGKVLVPSHCKDAVLADLASLGISQREETYTPAPDLSAPAPVEP